jgi:membrane-bound ClpP family serine protease
MVAAVVASLLPRPTSAATYEFEGPYAVRVLAQGLALEISGTFSWALPQQVGVALAETSNVRAIYLDSPGGHIKAALEVADLIRAHRLDTYVARMCASACTLAFLAGHQRLVSETARLGFHQAHGPGISAEQSNLLLRLAYENFFLPSAFIAHVLRTRPQDLWIPDLAELRKAGIVTAIAPKAALAVSAPVP